MWRSVKETVSSPIELTDSYLVDPASSHMLVPSLRRPGGREKEPSAALSRGGGRQQEPSTSPTTSALDRQTPRRGESL